ncbi:hypothetical protein [Streptomyces sp. PT12]|uniref:hypothetical protein n=1 Tax=Streptomyces sp. PT12 TaxID=1510197 RepID=UPI0015EE8DD1|nr:hypothetical protein [Streptomyces sp. PT12]
MFRTPVRFRPRWRQRANAPGESGPARGPPWRLRAVGQGHDHGLATLARHYGVDVEGQPIMGAAFPELLGYRRRVAPRERCGEVWAWSRGMSSRRGAAAGPIVTSPPRSPRRQGGVGPRWSRSRRGRFSRLDIRGLTSSALRVFGESRAVFDGVRVARCSAGLDIWGGGGTTADVTDAAFHDFDLAAVSVLGQARATLRRAVAERGPLGFGVGKEAQPFLHGCAATGARFADACGGRLVDCAVRGTRGAAVQANGRVDLVGLRTSLRVVPSTEPDERPPTVVNHFNGPVFNAEVSGAQLAWNNGTVTQNQQNNSAVAPGFEALAELIDDLLRQLPRAGLTGVV